MTGGAPTVEATYARAPQLAALVAQALASGDEALDPRPRLRAAIDELAAPRRSPIQAALARSNRLLCEGLLLAYEGRATAPPRPAAGPEPPAVIDRLVEIDRAVAAGDHAGARGGFAALAAEVVAAATVSPFFVDALPPDTTIDVKGWATGLSLLLVELRMLAAESADAPSPAGPEVTPGR